jgi:BirA family biotin operon repressor/biotin-[acetyl-CoA-carboxylase] ligase
MDWERRLAGIGLRRVVHLPSAASTNTLARRMAEEGAPDRTLVIADRQTRGRGRMDSRWSSGLGGLYFTLLLRPKLEPCRLADLSRVSADVCARSLAELTGLSMYVKPPNDVFAIGEHGGRKVCGILIEASGGARSVDWVVIGIGVNVNNRIPRVLTEAASLKGLTGRTFDPGPILKTLLRALVANFGSL